MNIIRKIFLPLVLLNITISANGWSFFNFSLGQILYWFIIYLSLTVLAKTRLSIASKVFFIFYCLAKFVYFINSIIFFNDFADFFSALILIFSSAKLFGDNYYLLMKQLLYFLALSVPILIIQKIGISSFFYGWNTEMFHLNDVYDFDAKNETGVLFKNVTLYKTLFTSSDNLVYVMYQARPTGLIYSNNVLSVIIVVTLALCFSAKNKISNFVHIILTLNVILVMSTLVYLSYIILIFRFKNRSISLIYFILFFILHFMFFPGLTEKSFGIVNLFSFVNRFGEIFELIGINNFFEIVNSYSNIEVINSFNYEQNSYSLFGHLLRYKYISLCIPLLLYFVYKYNYSINKLNSLSLNKGTPYATLFVVLIFSQFAIMFIRAPFFQIFLGISLYPLLDHLFKPKKRFIL